MLLEGLLDHGHQCFDLADRIGISPHQHAIDMPVAALERALVHVINRLAQDQRAPRKRAVHKRLSADVYGLVLKAYAVEFGEQHRREPPRRIWVGPLMLTCPVCARRIVAESSASVKRLRATACIEAKTRDN